MSRKQVWLAPAVAGGLAGIANGFFGGGGGMVLVPLLTARCGLDQRRAFATSVAIILPLCVLSSVIYLFRGGLDLAVALPYLAGGLAGGFLGGRLFQKLNMDWLRRAFALRRLQVALRPVSWLMSALAGAVTGVLSGFGVGGGTLLLIYMTAFAGVEQHLAQGINLLYFLPTAATALPAHIKNGYVDKKTAMPAILAGLAGTAAAAWVATTLDVHLLRRFFGAFLIYIGVRELFRRPRA